MFPLYNTYIYSTFAIINNTLTTMKTRIDIRRAIEERGYTIASLCKEHNLRSQNIIQNYINGNPSVKKLEELCEKMGCDVTDLFFPIEEEVNDVKAWDGVNEKEKGKSEIFRSECETQPVIAFCPHCGAKVRIGAVLLPD